MERKTCLFCLETETMQNVMVKKPTVSGFQTILKCANEKNDNISKTVLQLKNDLLAHPTRYQFHISCRKSFCSKNNIMNANKETSEESSCSFQRSKD